MSLEKKIFEFDQFVLDLSDRTLYRDGQVVDLSLKAFELLRVLFENRPLVVEKKALMDAVWPDSFVEEGNLTFTVSQLRRLLGDSKQNPRIIETVHRRGYRFVADARPCRKASATVADGSVLRPTPWLRWVAASAALLLTLFVGGLMLSGRSPADPRPLTRPISTEKLSTTGKVAHAVISRDGKYVVYTNGTGLDQQSVWLRQLDSGTNVELIGPSDHQYLGLALSPDGDTIYFARKTSESLLTIFRLSIFGGLPAKIADGTHGWMSISPDGTRISFVRCQDVHEENCSLYTADAVDGKNERKLVTYNGSTRIADNEFSPDGRSIAYAYGQSDDGEDNFRLAEVDIDSGTTRDLSTHSFFIIKAILWLPDNRGWLVTANRKTWADTPILHLPFDGGEPVKIIQDSEAYSGLSATADLRSLVATQVRRDTSLYMIDIATGKEQNLGGPTSTVTISGDNRIYFSSAASGNFDIWSADADGSARRQLTNEPGIDFVPLVSRDNKTIFFSSSRSGEPQIWRMNADGGEQSRVTQVNGGWPVFLSPDGNWLYYRHWSNETLWRVSTVTGEEMEVLARKAPRFSISPDGSTALIGVTKDGQASLELVELGSGITQKAFVFPDIKVKEYAWSGDGRSFVYVTERADGTKEIWRLQVAGGTPRKLKKLDRIDPVHHFSAAPDGRRFAIIQGGWKHDAVLLTGAHR